MKKLAFLPLLFLAAFAAANNPISQCPPTPAPDFTVTTSDGQVKKLYQDYINQQKLVVIEAFFTTCPPCATHTPLVKNLYSTVQAAHPGKVEFILLSTLISDTNLKVAQYKTNNGISWPGVGKDGGSITALQPYLNGQFGPFQGTPTFIVIAPGSGAVSFDIRGLSPTETINLLQQKIEEFFPKICSLENPFGTPLDDVNVAVNTPAFDTSFVANGSYSLAQVAPLQNTAYNIKPRKTGNNSGLTTYDLVLMSKHILAIEPFHCPWQIIAADVNCTGSVTTFDIVTARKVILGILDSFPCGSWRFMPDSASVSNGNCQDFIGVKLGDVNAGPCTDSLLAPAESRTQTQTLYFHDHDFQPGETAQISLFFAAPNTLDGLQFSLNFDPNLLKIKNIAPGILEGFGAESFRLSDHDLACSWLQVQGQNIPASAPLLTLDITAPQGGTLRELLQFSTAKLQPEIYDAEGYTHPLQLAPLPTFHVFLISPNPTQGQFTLQTNAEREGESLVQMLDVQGRIVFEKSYPTTLGLNYWGIEKFSSGLFFLKVNGEAAGKVIVEQ